MNKELRKKIVAGKVAEYAKQCAGDNRLSDEELKEILTEIANLL